MPCMCITVVMCCALYVLTTVVCLACIDMPCMYCALTCLVLTCVVCIDNSRVPCMC